MRKLRCYITFWRMLIVNYHPGSSIRSAGGDRIFPIRHSRRCPIKQFFCHQCRQIDTAMTHRRPEIIVPIGAVKPKIFIKIHRIRNIRQIIISVQFLVSAGHFCVFKFAPDIKFPRRRPAPLSGRDQAFQKDTPAFPGS